VDFTNLLAGALILVGVAPALLAERHAGGRAACVVAGHLAALDGHVGGDVGAARPPQPPAARRVAVQVGLGVALVPAALGPLLGHFAAHLGVQEAVQHRHAETLHAKVNKKI